MPLAAKIAIGIALWALVAVLLVWRAGNAIDPEGRQPARKYRFTKARA